MTTKESIRVYTIYCVTNVKNNKRYVGQTCFTAMARWKKHVWLAGRGGKTRFYEAIRKHGVDAFKVIDLESGFTDGTVANLAEKTWIAAFKSQDPEFGYNSTDGGDQRNGSRWNLSPEAAEKARLSKIGKPLWTRRKKTDEKHRPIVEAFKAGKTRKQIAKEFSLKETRVVKILLRWKAYHEPTLCVGSEHQYVSTSVSLQRLADEKIRSVVDDLLTGSSYKSIAEKHGVEYGNVKTIVARARKRWKELRIPEDHPLLKRKKNQHA